MEKCEFIKKYSEQIRQKRAAVFAGAGLSVSAGFVNWKELLRPLAEELGLSMEKEHDYPEMAQFHCTVQDSRTAINNRIRDEFSTIAGESKSIEILTRLLIDTYWTTNYDRLLEDGLDKNQRTYEVKITEDSLALNQTDISATVYKMHGDAQLPESIVLTKDDYETYGRKREGFTTVLKSHLLSKTFLFIGFSFDDPNLKSVLAWMKALLKENKGRHYCLFEKVSKKQDESEKDFLYRKQKRKYQIDDLMRYGIDAVLLDSYDEVPDLLCEIEKRCNMKNVFLSGSVSVYSESWPQEKTEEFAKKLANRLVAKKMRITSGYGLGIGSAVITGALTETRNRKYAHFDEYLKLYPFPQPGQGEDYRKKWHEYRKEIMRDCGIAVFMFGNKKDKNGEAILADGMMVEFEIAKEYSCVIIPVAATGMTSEKIYQNMFSDRDKYPYLEGYWEELKEGSNPDKIADIIVRIIEKKLG